MSLKVILKSTNFDVFMRNNVQNQLHTEKHYENLKIKKRKMKKHNRKSMIQYLN